MKWNRVVTQKHRKNRKEERKRREGPTKEGVEIKTGRGEREWKRNNIRLLIMDFKKQTIASPVLIWINVY